MNAQSGKFVIGQGNVNIQTDANVNTILTGIQDVLPEEGENVDAGAILNGIRDALAPKGEGQVPLVGVIGGEAQFDKNLFDTMGGASFYAAVASSMVDDSETKDTLNQIAGLTNKLTLIPTITEANPDTVVGDITYVVGTAPDDETEEGNSPVVIGGIGGDLSINSGLHGNYNISLGTPSSDNVLPEMKEYTFERDGRVDMVINSGNLLGGVGGSAAVSVGNVDVALGETQMTAGSTSITASADLHFDGKNTTILDKDVNVGIYNGSNVAGFATGGLAAAIGGESTTIVKGDTNVKINSKVNLLNNKDGITAGITGGGAAISTIGGTAISTVGGNSTIAVEDGLSLGILGGGAAASADITGALEQIYKPGGKELDLGNNDKHSEVTGGQLEAWLNEGKGQDDQISLPDKLTVTISNIIDGGTATSEVKGTTDIELNGKTTAVGVVGGGLAAASHTYTVRDESVGGALPTYEGGTYNVGDAYGHSNATATTGRSNIVVNLQGSQNVGALKDAVNAITGGDINSDALDSLKGQGMALGILGGGIAIGHGSASSMLTAGNGATAKAYTNGADIDLRSGYAAAVFGGGAALTINDARAEASMKDAQDLDKSVDVNITTYDGMKTVGIWGGGLALSMEGSTAQGKSSGADEVLASANVDTVNIVNEGATDGIFGGGMAIGNSNRTSKGILDAVSSVGTSNITVNGGTVDNLNLKAFMDATKNNNETVTGWESSPWWNHLGYNASGAMVDLKGITDETSIAAGGFGMGMTGQATVGKANVTIKGGIIEKDILGGGIAIDNMKKDSGSQVTESIINLDGGTVNGSVYAGGAINGSTAETAPDVTDGGVTHTGYPTDYTASKVGTAEVYLNGTAVGGEISGQGYELTTNYENGNYNPYNTATPYENISYDKGIYDTSVGTSKLYISGTNTLTPLDTTKGKYTSDSKIHDFDTITVKADSVTKVEGLTANNTIALIKGGKVTTEAGAYLDISKLGADGPYLIADKTQQGSTFWSDDALLYDRMSGVYATTDVGTDDSSYTVNYEAVTEENADEAAGSFAENLGAEALLPTLRDGMGKGWNPENGLTEGGVQYIRDWMNNAPAMNAQYGRGVMIGEDAAVTGNTVSIARDMADNVMQRLSFTDDYVQDAGWVNNDGGIWAKYIHRKYETEGMGSSFGGIHSSTDYDGAIVGVDFAKHGNFQSGVAFHYGSGDGNGLISRNDYDAWGFTLYGSLKDEEAGTNLMADVGYVTSDNDIDGTVNGKSLSADRDVDAWTIGLRGEKEYVFGQNQLVPYVGLRYMSVNPARYSVYYDGAKAFNADADNQNLWLLPIGVSFRNETVTDGGWRITPKLDLSYIWAFGDTDTDMTLDMGGVGSGLYYDVMDDNSWLASLGVEATKDVWSFGVGYGYQKGDDTKNKTWFVNASYAF